MRPQSSLSSQRTDKVSGRLGASEACGWDPMIRRGHAKSGASKKKALCIGINDYPGTGSDLAGCVNDANDWAHALGSRGFSVDTLLNRAATRAAIRNEIGSLVSSANSGDLVVIQFSGHGSFVPDLDGDEPDGTDECLCPHDVRKNGYITDDEMFELFSLAARGVRVVMVSDSCHSGTIARFQPIVTPPTVRGRSAPQRKVRFLPPSAFLGRSAMAKLGERRMKRASSPPGRYAGLSLSGCQDSEYSYDAYFMGRPNGVFTFAALSTLAKLRKHATYRDWHKAIRRVLPSQQYPQSPNLYGSTAMKMWPALE